jgi:hypothetical protein
MIALLRLAWDCASFFLTVPWMLPAALLVRGPSRPWVVGGHRGRLRLDNAGAFHEHLVSRTGQRALWVTGNPALLRELRARGLGAVRRNSLRARWAILTAPVLVYSHGDDDLDVLLILLRRVLGFRVYLDHSMNYLKAGEFHLPALQRGRGLSRAILAWVQTDFDVLLASSETEVRNFELSFPHKRGSILTGGGAHLDVVLRGRAVPPEATIFYFPTFREDAAGRAQLDRVLEELAASERLRGCLQEAGLRLLVGGHINARGWGAAASPFGTVPPAEIGSQLLSCTLFVSDYSGMLFDCLALGKPVVFFAFDLDAYRVHRNFYTPYEELGFGPLARTADELVEIVCSGRWRGSDAERAAADAWRRRIFPTLEPTYAASTHAAILREVRRRAPRLAPPTAGTPGASPAGS